MDYDVEHIATWHCSTHSTKVICGNNNNEKSKKKEQQHIENIYRWLFKCCDFISSILLAN